MGEVNFGGLKKILQFGVNHTFYLVNLLTQARHLRIFFWTSTLSFYSFLAPWDEDGEVKYIPHKKILTPIYLIIKHSHLTLFLPGSGMTLSAGTGPLWPFFGLSQFWSMRRCTKAQKWLASSFLIFSYPKTPKKALYEL